MAVRCVRQIAWFLRIAVTLSGVLLGGTTAHAGCGDQARAVFITIESTARVADLGRSPTRLGATPLPADEPRPCIGPSCSRQPAVPLAISAPDRPPTDSGLGSIRAIPTHSLDERPVIARPRGRYASPAVDPLDRPPRP